MSKLIPEMQEAYDEFNRAVDKISRLLHAPRMAQQLDLDEHDKRVKADVDSTWETALDYYEPYASSACHAIVERDIRVRKATLKEALAAIRLRENDTVETVLKRLMKEGSLLRVPKEKT